MKISDKGLNLLKQFEGCSLKPYSDAVGVATIGYGCTFYENGEKVQLSDAEITEERATELLKNVLKQFENDVAEVVKVDLTQSQFDALVCFAYNTGSNALRNSTLLKKLNDGDTLGATCEFTRWHFANKKALKGLLRRRLAEAVLFLSD